MTVLATPQSDSGAWVVCELVTHTRLGDCLRLPAYLRSRFDLYRSPDRKLLAVAGDAREFFQEQPGGPQLGYTGPSWSVAALDNRTLLEPTEYPLAKVAALALTDSAIVVVAPATVPEGSAELWAYQLNGDRPELIDRHMLIPTAGATVVGGGDPPLVYVTESQEIVLGTSDLQLLRISIPDRDWTPQWLSDIVPWLLPKAPAQIEVAWSWQPSSFQAGAAAAIALSPDGELLAVAAGDQISLVSVRDGVQLAPPMSLSELCVFTDPLTTIVVDADYQVTVMNGDCVLVREPPPAASELTRHERLDLAGLGSHSSTRRKALMPIL